MLATIKAVGIVQPPVVAPEMGGGNGYSIDAGHRRAVAVAANDNGAMRSMVESSVRGAEASDRRRKRSASSTPPSVAPTDPAFPTQFRF
ncbi:hypothetical protein ASE37_22895 [Rhizobium sp. Root268]|nr:hypothetical protein ASC86_21850 [Rhizobium sp. Root1212]KRD31606.1 hypothetical protein ASE37_22895 [Rhizobium sp. Root268]